MKKNHAVSLNDYFNSYSIPSGDVEAIKEFLKGNYEAIKGHPDIAHSIFNVMDPYIRVLMSKKAIEHDKEKIRKVEYETRAMEDESEEFQAHSYDIIARRVYYRIVEKAMILAGIIDSDYQFIRAYRNQEIMAGVVILLYEYDYFKPVDAMGRTVTLTTVMRAFQEWYNTPLLQPIYRDKKKCVALAKQKLIIILEIERNRTKNSNLSNTNPTNELHN